MSTLRLPALKQLKRMGSRDAAAILDYQESELQKLLSNIPKRDPRFSTYRRNTLRALRRLQKRRTDFLG